MLAVVAASGDEQSHTRAESLARELQLPLVKSSELSPERFALALQVSKRGLELGEVGRRRSRPVRVDFARGPTAYRLRTARVGRQLIARAVGLRGGAVTVLDATAGFGRDAFLLAHLGCRVVAVERSAVVGALLRDGLARAAAETRYELDTIAKRIRLVIADSRSVLREMPDADAPDVVYLDPMYPSRKKSALAKKEMRICRMLVGDDPDALDLLEVARGVARQRVVVKRQRHAPPLAPGRAIEYLGRTVRYDVYDPIRRSE
ncbi:MAG: class I SAM-dependent methyltransferase [Planctomycetota bacterium]|jgi:16S rRNA (guanine1516-N2)-methyltransferase